MSEEQEILVVPCRRSTTRSLKCAHRRLLISVDGIDVAGLEAAGGEELGGDLSLKEELLLGHLDQDETHQFAHVHAADHLLKPAC